MVTPTRLDDGRPDAADVSVRAWPVPRAPFSCRDLALMLLRVAGDVGVTDRELAEAGISNSWAHIESLRFEGMGIRTFEGRDDRGQAERRHYLTKDAWARPADPPADEDVQLAEAALPLFNEQAPA